MKRKDIILIIVILIVAGMGFGAKSLFAQKGGEVIIKVDGKDYGTYPLNEDKTIDIDEHNKVIIKEGVVYMEDANCPDKLCIKQGKIDSNGQKAKMMFKQNKLFDKEVGYFIFNFFRLYSELKI